MCSTDIKLLLLHRYETKYKIYNHDASDDSQNPLALVRMHWSEDTISTSRTSERDQQFIDLEVHRWTGMSLKEFLDFPTWRVTSILKQCAAKQKERNTPSSKLKEAIDQLSDVP